MGSIGRGREADGWADDGHSRRALSERMACCMNEQGHSMSDSKVCARLDVSEVRRWVSQESILDCPAVNDDGVSGQPSLVHRQQGEWFGVRQLAGLLLSFSSQLPILADLEVPIGRLTSFVSAMCRDGPKQTRLRYMLSIQSSLLFPYISISSPDFRRPATPAVNVHEMAFGSIVNEDMHVPFLRHRLEPRSIRRLETPNPESRKVASQTARTLRMQDRPSS